MPCSCVTYSSQYGGKLIDVNQESPNYVPWTQIQTTKAVHLARGLSAPLRARQPQRGDQVAPFAAAPTPDNSPTPDSAALSPR